MIIMNKKAQWSTIQKVVLMVVLLGVLLYFTGALKNMGTDSFNFLKKSQPQNDFDIDGMPDGVDPCPCGSPENQKDLTGFFDGIKKCIQKLESCSENVEEYGFTTEEDARRGEVCTYQKQHCTKFIEAKADREEN